MRCLQRKQEKDMTEEEVKKIPFHMQFHMAMRNEHVCTYVDDSGRLAFCDHTPVTDDFDGMQEFGRGYRHYRIDDKVFKSYKKWIEALKDVTL